MHQTRQQTMQQTRSDQHAASITEAIVGFAVDTPGAAIAESARQVARLSLLDWLAVARAGREETVSRIVRQDGGRGGRDRRGDRDRSRRQAAGPGCRAGQRHRLARARL